MKNMMNSSFSFKSSWCSSSYNSNDLCLFFCLYPSSMPLPTVTVCLLIFCRQLFPCRLCWMMDAALRECKCLPWQMSSLACHGCSQELLASFRTIRDGGRDPNNLPYLGTHRAKELLQLADVTLRSRWRPWLLAGAVPWLRLPVRIAAGAEYDSLPP